VQESADSAPAEGGEKAPDFDRLFAENYAGIVRVAYRVVGDTACAEDIAAEAFWKLHRNPPAVGGNWKGWVYRTALRLALDNLRKRNRRIRYEAKAAAAETAPGPDEMLERSRRRERVRQVLAALKPRHSELLVLRSEGYTLSEAALMLNVKVSSVGTFLARADEAFRKEYVKRYGAY